MPAQKSPKSPFVPPLVYKKHNPFREEVATDVCSVARQFGISQQKGLSKVALLRFCELLNFCKLLCISTLMFRDHQPRQRNSTSQGKSRDGKQCGHIRICWTGILWSIQFFQPGQVEARACACPRWPYVGHLVALPCQDQVATTQLSAQSWTRFICLELRQLHSIRPQAAEDFQRLSTNRFKRLPELLNCCGIKKNMASWCSLQTYFPYFSIIRYHLLFLRYRRLWNPGLNWICKHKSKKPSHGFCTHG